MPGVDYHINIFLGPTTLGCSPLHPVFFPHIPNMPPQWSSTQHPTAEVRVIWHRPIPRVNIHKSCQTGGRYLLYIPAGTYKKCGKTPWLMGKSTIKTIFNSYVKFPEGSWCIRTSILSWNSYSKPTYLV